MSVNDYLFRPIPGPYFLHKRLWTKQGTPALFRVDPDHEARVLATVRERLRVREANERLSQ